MKKLTAVALLAALALGSACSSSSKTPSPSNTTATTEPSTQSGSGPTKAECATMANTYAGLMSQYVDTVQGITYATPELVAVVLATGHEAVAAGRRILAQCGHYSPTEAAQVSKSLDTLESSLNDVQGLQTS